MTLWPWQSIGFQILLRTKHVPSLVKIHWRMLILVFTEMLQKVRRTERSITISLRNFFGEGIIMDGFSGGYAYFFPMDRVMVRQVLSFSKNYELLIKYIYLINHSIQFSYLFNSIQWCFIFSFRKEFLSGFCPWYSISSC